ncbi:methyltransferase domain-containing protein [Bradyrhizobium genosp. P]|uniref:methyltransferase domain-containing protein n=1 Tax=Bradyrhizobium genosp. P TaxID=83641 RepID=UPI003CF30A89
MRAQFKRLVLSTFPPIRRLYDHRNEITEQLLAAEREKSDLREQQAKLMEQRDNLIEQQTNLIDQRANLERQQANLIERQTHLREQLAQSERALGNARRMIDEQPQILRFRRAIFEAKGEIAPEGAMPSSKPWPLADHGLSYRDKLVSHLPLKTGRGAEIGPLNQPLLSKEDADVLYVDHLDTAGLCEKYSFLNDIKEVDRPMVDNNIEKTLRGDAPLDYVVASQVMEHVPNPIRWMNEIAAVLRTNGLLSISLPDRRNTFDLYREDSRASDLVAAYIADLTVPDARAVYDHHSQAAAVHFEWARPETSKTPQQVIDGQGSVSAEILASDPISLAQAAHGGNYLDVHCWVFTSSSFLMAMAEVASEGLLPFRCKQFYPTRLESQGRDNHSFVVVLEKTEATRDDIRRSFLEALL